MACEKRRYNKKEAQGALNIMLEKGVLKNGTGRIYECRLCDCWHLTSQDKMPFEKPVSVKLSLFKKWKSLLK